MAVKLEQQTNLSGDGKLANQGFGKLSDSELEAFNPKIDLERACAFFREFGYVVLSDCLNPQEIEHLNEFYDLFSLPSGFSAFTPRPQRRHTCANSEFSQDFGTSRILLASSVSPGVITFTLLRFPPIKDWETLPVIHGREDSRVLLRAA